VDYALERVFAVLAGT